MDLILDRSIYILICVSIFLLLLFLQDQNVWPLPNDILLWSHGLV